ncbi:hypothetical protein SAZ11_06595 [Streptomyces sp. FXJ1.4098]|nr:hypothetical protein [Streptomyces sp. FXJ1.4098]
MLGIGFARLVRTVRLLRAVRVPRCRIAGGRGSLVLRSLVLPRNAACADRRPVGARLGLVGR